MNIIKIRLQEALAHHNEMTGDKMDLSSLAQKIEERFNGKPTARTILNYFSRNQNEGSKDQKQMPLPVVIEISRITKVPINYLVGKTDDSDKTEVLDMLFDIVKSDLNTKPNDVLVQIEDVAMSIVQMAHQIKKSR